MRIVMIRACEGASALITQGEAFLLAAYARIVMIWCATSGKGGVESVLRHLDRKIAGPLSKRGPYFT